MTAQAKELVKLLDGMTIREARMTLEYAIDLLMKTQRVSKDSLSHADMPQSSDQVSF